MNCTEDSDCPGAQVCYQNVSWRDEANFCDCSNWYGRRGAFCEDLTGTSYILILLGVMMFLIAFILFGIAMTDISQTILFFRKFDLNSSNTTLLFVTCGLLCFCLWQVFYTLEQVPKYVTLFDSDGEKTSVFNSRSKWSIMFCEAFSLFASLNVSVMWVEVSRRTRNFSPKMANNVNIYRKACISVGGVFSILMIIVAVTGKTEWGAILAIPFLFVLAVTFLIGRNSMIHLLEEALSKMSDSSGQKSSTLAAHSATPEKTSADRTRRTIQVIRKCSTHVILALFGIVLSGLAYFLVLSIPSGGWKEVNGFGEISTAPMIGELLPVNVLYLLVTIFWYAHRSNRKVLRRERETLDIANPTGASVSKEFNTTSYAQSFTGNSRPSTFQTRIDSP